MLIVGMTGCGKTYYLLDLIASEYKKHFDYIILICPTFRRNKTYTNWEYISDDDVVVIECEHHSVNEVIKYVRETYEDTNSLIIIDDCASSRDIKNRTSEVVNLGFSGRHYSLSTIIITQQLTSIAKPFRENISKLVCFYNPNRKDMRTIFDDYLDGLNSIEYEEIKEKLKNTKYARLEIDLVSPYKHAIILP